MLDETVIEPPSETNNTVLHVVQNLGACSVTKLFSQWKSLREAGKGPKSITENETDLASEESANPRKKM